MSSNFFKFLILLVFLIYPKNSFGENIAYLDIDFIMNNSLAGKSLTKTLEKNFKSKNDKLKKIENELKDKEKKLVSQKNILSENEYRKNADILMKEIKKYNDEKNNFLKEFKQKKIEVTKLLLSKINPILADYSSDKSIDIILQKKNIVIGKKNLDITQEIIEILNAKVKKIDVN